MSPVRSWSERRKEAADAPKREGFRPLDPGVYNFVIKEPAEVGTSPGTGLTSWNVKVTVEDGERANATMYHTFYDSEKPGGVAFLLEQFSALGLDPLLDAEAPDEQIANAMLGKRFSAEVYKNTYNGKEKMKLRSFRPPSGAPVGGTLGGPAPAFGGGPGGPSAGPSAPAQQAYQQPAPQQYQQPVQQQPAPQQNYQNQPQQGQFQQPQAQQQPAQQNYQNQPQQGQQGGSPWETGDNGIALPQF